MQGHAVFADRLARFAAALDELPVTAIARRTAPAVTVSVRGRRGVGCRTVARALASSGIAVASDGDIDVHVVAEVVKPEDRAAITGSTRPTLVVLNKADLIATPRVFCERYRKLTGAPTVPMVAHLAVAQIDNAMLSALRELASAPPNRPQAPIASWLLDALDMAGIGCAVRALRGGADGDAVRRALQRSSGVDGVVTSLAPLMVEVGYGRVGAAVGALHALAATADEDQAGQIADFLSDDDTALACMAAAVDVVEASGMTVDRGDDAAAHLRRAAHWHRFRRAPVNAVHRRCADDIVRGSLRLWRHAQRAST
jgi:hypothetical protein